MTCINGKYENGKPTYTKGYPVQLMKCLKGGLPCYQDKGGDTNGERENGDLQGLRERI